MDDWIHIQGKEYSGKQNSEARIKVRQKNKNI